MSPHRRTRGLRCCRKLVATAAPPTGATKYSATLCEIACSITCRCQGMASALACGVGVGVGAGFWRYAVMPLCR